MHYAGSALPGSTRIYWRVRFRDSGSRVGPWSTETASFITVPAPLEPTTLFVNSSSAQSGIQGNPVSAVDMDPVFSAIANHQDSLSVAKRFRVQVATDSAFSNVLWTGTRNAQNTAASSRTPDLQYTGPALASNTTYYWRARTRDQNSFWSPWSTEAASFTTIACDLTVSDIMYHGFSGPVSITGCGMTNTISIDFGADIVVGAFTVNSDTLIVVNITVGQRASVGTRTFAVTTFDGVNTTTLAGQAYVIYPTDILPGVANQETSRSPATGGVGVVLHNGAFFKGETDLATRGRMIGLSWSRTYASPGRFDYNGPLGNGWMGYYYQRAIWNGSTGAIAWYTPDARIEQFAFTGSVWTSPAGVYVQASRDSGTGEITFKDRHGFQCKFNSDGRLISCTDRNGNATTCSYNGVGQLEIVTDDRGFDYEISYYADGRVESVTDNVWDGTSPRVVVYEYDANGDLVLQKAPETARYSDANNNRTAYGYTYASNHFLTECTNPREVALGGGSYLQNTFDASGRVIEQRLGTTGQNIYLRYTVDGSSNTLIREVDRRGLRTDTTLDTLGRATKVERFNKFWEVDTTTPIDHSTIVDVGGKVRASDPVDSYVTTVAYNANHEVTQVVSPRGNSVEYTYDTSGNHLANGNVLETRRKDNALGTLADIVSTFTYESTFQFLKTATNPRGFVTTNTYDYEESSGTAGNLVRVRGNDVTLGQPATQVIQSTTTYNSFGQPLSSTDAEGNVSAYEYYASGPMQGFLHKVIVASGSLNLTSEYEYDRVGNQTGMWPPRAFESPATKDDFKTIIKVNELNQTLRVQGRVLFVGGTERSDSYSFYDLNGNVVSSLRNYVTWDGNVPAAPGNENDPTTFSKSPNAMAATWVESTSTYNLLNYRVTSTVEAIAGSTITTYTSSVEYDDNYNVTASTTPLGFRHETVFDERELVFRSISGAGTGVSATFASNYDLNGNLVESFDANNNKTEYEYDGFDRTSLVRDAAGHYSTTTYDANSNVVTSSSFDSANTLLTQGGQTYDELDRSFQSTQLAKKIDGTDIGDGVRTSVTLFDRNSRVTESTDDNSVKSYMFYDAANRTTHTIDNIGNRVDYTYNLDSTVIETKFTEINDLSSALEVSHSENIVDYLNRTTEFRDQRYNALTRPTQSRMFYDGWSRTVVRQDAAGTEINYEYDLLSRTTRTISRPTTSIGQWVILDYTYDNDSRNLTRTVWNDPGTYSAAQTTSYAYDARNRLVSLTRPDSDVWTYTYDAQSNRTGWTDPQGTSVADTFDNRNLLTGRAITRGTNIMGATREAFTYDGLRRLLTSNNYETIGANEFPLVEQAWEYNTLSLPEKHTQGLHNGAGGNFGTFETEAEYDALGLNTGTTYADGRHLTHTFDTRNRLQETYDDTNLESVATYAYANNRLIERGYGNGVSAHIEYESSGCGCGGFSALCESVKHGLPGGLGTPLFQEERQYDVIGNVAADRRNHQGGYGEVHSYDDTYRLVDTYRGVPLQGSAFGGGSTPASFRLQRHYELDTRGNRSNVVEKSQGGGTIYDTAYTPNAQTNVYEDVDGQSFTYDSIEQTTFDPSTGMHIRYDYKGNRVAMDDDAAFTTPERVYIHDAQARLRVERSFAEGSYYGIDNIFNVFDPPCKGCGCSVPALHISQSIKTDGQTGAALTDTQRVSGLMVSSGGSATGTSPATAVGLPGGGLVGNGVIQERVTDAAGNVKINYHHENQLGSLIGMTDATGLRVAEFDYSEYGQVFEKHILWDGFASGFDHLEGFGSTTRIFALAGNSLPTNMENALIRVVSEAAGAPYVWLGRAIGTGFDALQNLAFVDVDDPTGAIFAGIEEFDGDFVVFRNYRGGNLGNSNPHSAGQWSSVSYDSLSNTTTFTDASATFAAQALGWWIQPDARMAEYRTIIGVSATTITVQGQASSLASGPVFPDFIGDWYQVVWPVGVDPVTGTLAHGDPCEPSSRILFAGYYYMPPIAGTTVAPQGGGENSAPGIQVLSAITTTTTYGQQSGLNLAGDYYCHNRIYEPTRGRWTTTDPIATPSYALSSYVGASPVSTSDPSGLADFAKQVTHRARYKDGTIGSWNFTIEANYCTRPTMDRVEAGLKRVLTALAEKRWHLHMMIDNWDRLNAGGRMDDQYADFRRTRDATVRFFLQSGELGNLARSDMISVRDVLDKTIKAFDNATIEFECSCCTDRPTDIMNLGLGPFCTYWFIRICIRQALALSDKEFAAALFHELTHEYANTEDFGYVVSLIAKSPKYTDKKERPVTLTYKQLQDNASTYEHWLSELGL